MPYRAYRVKWPDSSVQLVLAENDADLFDVLDEEGCPYDAVIEEVELPDGLKLSEQNCLKILDDTLAGARVIRHLTKSDLDRAFDALYGIELNGRAMVH